MCKKNTPSAVQLQKLPCRGGVCYEQMERLASVTVCFVLVHGDIVVEDVDALQALIGEAGGSVLALPVVQAGRQIGTLMPRGMTSALVMSRVSASAKAL